MQGQTGLGPVWALKSSPRVRARSCSTSGVHEPQEAEALVWALTDSRVVSPSLPMAPVIAPLQTPLQPQISAVSASAATADLGSWPARPSVTWRPKIRVSRMGETSSPRRIRSKYQAPSAASPNSTAPARRPSSMTSRL